MMKLDKNPHYKIVNETLNKMDLRGNSTDLFGFNINNNMAIAADSGAGKSFFINEIVKSYLVTNSKVSVIDVGHSYKDTCSVLEGQYIKFSREAEICINPFSFIKLKLDDNNNVDYSLDDNIYQIILLETIFLVSAGISEADSRYEAATNLFEQAIISSLQTNSTYTTVYEQLIKVDDNTGLSKFLAAEIRGYTKNGIFGRYFEGKANLNIDNDFIVWELEELQSKPILKFTVLLILMFKAYQDMYLSSPAQNKICIIDDACNLMSFNSSPNTSKFIEFIPPS